MKCTETFVLAASRKWNIFPVLAEITASLSLQWVETVNLNQLMQTKTKARLNLNKKTPSATNKTIKIIVQIGLEYSGWSCDLNNKLSPDN